MQVRAAREADRPGISRVIEAAFGHTGVAELWSEVEARGHDRGSLVGVEGEQIVGHIGLSDAWLDARRELVDILLLGPLSVDADHQGAGFGTALVAAAVEAARASDAPMLVLEGGPRYYGTRGFTPGAEHGIEPPTRRTPPPACQVMLLATYEPWMRGRIIYRDVWWEHDAAGLRDPDLADVERATGQAD